MLTIMEVKGVYSDVALSATPTPYRVYIYITIITYSNKKSEGVESGYVCYCY